MKKIVSIVLAIIFCVSIVSCGKKKVEYTFHLGEGAADTDRVLKDGYQSMDDLDFMHLVKSIEKLDESAVLSSQSFSIDG